MESTTSPDDMPSPLLARFPPDGPFRFGAGTLCFDLGLDIHTDPSCRFWVEMTPKTFLDLAPPLEFLDAPDEIPALAASGHVFAPPRLHIDTDPDFGLDSYPVVTAHDGRHRMLALCDQDLGDVPLPVLVGTGHTPCAWLVAEDVVRFRSAAWTQAAPGSRSFLLKGPLFGAALVNDEILPPGAVDDLYEFLSPR